MSNQVVGRQGDLLFVSVELTAKQIASAQPVARQNGRIVLALGETTGHSHVVVAPDVRLVQIADMRVLLSAVPFPVVHEEHSAITLPVGAIEVINQYEYSPEIVRQVLD